MRNKQLITVLVLIFTTLVGCTTSPLEPFENRIAIYVQQPVSLTTDYALLSMPFDTLIKAILSPPFVDLPEIYNWDGAQRPAIATYQNPFFPSRDSAKASYFLASEVERVGYEPVSDIEEKLSAYAFGGVFLMWLADEGDLMAAHVQYRFRVFDSAYNLVGSFVVIGASSDELNAKGRRELSEEANILASAFFCKQLFGLFSTSKQLEIRRGKKTPMTASNQREHLITQLSNLLGTE